MHTDCSGELGPECCMHMMSQAMRERGTDILPVDRIILWRACDKSPLAKRVIVNHKLCPLHVFDGMLENPRCQPARGEESEGRGWGIR